MTQLIYGNLYDTVKESYSGNSSGKREELQIRINNLESDLKKIEAKQNKIEDIWRLTIFRKHDL
jgi:predicted mannosyl-3-phosphoglycerate phosphatase (HAD superfamily)